MCLLQGLDYPPLSALLSLSLLRAKCLSIEATAIYIFLPLKLAGKNSLVCLNSFAGVWAGAREGAVCLGEPGTRHWSVSELSLMSQPHVCACCLWLGLSCTGCKCLLCWCRVCAPGWWCRCTWRVLFPQYPPQFCTAKGRYLLTRVQVPPLKRGYSGLSLSKMVETIWYWGASPAGRRTGAVCAQL